eukprot:Gb_25437 [translate_table: standard]
MGILGGNLIADAEYFVIRYHYFRDVIDGQETIMILSAEILPCSTNYSVTPSRCELVSLPRKVSSLVLEFLISGKRSPEPIFLNLGIGLLGSRVMGGDPLVTEPAVIKMDDEVDGLAFTISEGLIAEVSGLPLDGEVISRENTNQIEQLTKFIREDETFCWLQSGIARESQLVPWDRVVVQIMKYLTLEGKFKKLFGYHIAILNSIRNSTKINLPVVLGETKNPSPSVTLRGLVRSSGTPVSRAQLLLGPLTAVPKSSVEPSVSEDEEDSLSEDCGTSGCKKGCNQKRKPVPQTLAVNLAKCSRRSVLIFSTMRTKTFNISFNEFVEHLA